MKVPSEFNMLCGFFHQDVFLFYPKFEDAISESAHCLTKAERPIVRDFLQEVLASNLSDEEVEELWRQSPSHIGFSEPRGARDLLESLRDALDAQIARDAASSKG